MADWLTRGSNVGEEGNCFNIELSKDQMQEDAFVMCRISREMQDWLEDVKFGVSAGSQVQGMIDKYLTPEKMTWPQSMCKFIPGLLDTP